MKCVCNLDHKDNCEHKLSICPGWHLGPLLSLHIKCVNLEPALFPQQVWCWIWSEPRPLPSFNPFGKRLPPPQQRPCNTNSAWCSLLVSWQAWRWPCFLFNLLITNLLYEVLVCKHRQLSLYTEECKELHNIFQIKICTVNKSILGKGKLYRTTCTVSNTYCLEEQINNYWTLWKHYKCYQWLYLTSKFALKQCRLLIMNGPNLPLDRGSL